MHCFPTMEELKQAQMLLEQDDPQMAMKLLDLALSSDFGIRNRPLFQVLKAQCLRHPTNHPTIENEREALECLKVAMDLPGVRQIVANTEVALHDRVSLFVEMFRVNETLGDKRAALKVLGEAQELFRGTLEESRIKLAQCESEVKEGKFNEAMVVLNSIDVDDSCFLDAKKRMADIYLHHFRDTRLFIQCFKDLAERKPSNAARQLLGKAYAATNQLHLAIRHYKNVMKTHPSETLCVEIASLLTKVHQYEEATDFYKRSLILYPQNAILARNFCDLNRKLGKYLLAENVMANCCSGRICN